MVNPSLEYLHPSLTPWATIYQRLVHLSIVAFSRKFASPVPLEILRKRIVDAPWFGDATICISYPYNTGDVE